MVDAHNDMTVFVVSDGTGDTGSAAVRAAMIQFRHRWRLRVFRDTRTISEVRRVVEQAEQANALVVFSLVEGEVVEALSREADQRGVVAVDLLGPLIMRVAQRLISVNRGASGGSLMNDVRNAEHVVRRRQGFECPVLHSLLQRIDLHLHNTN